MLKVKIFENKFKKGMSSALNFGIKNADGEFIAMQDSDDLWTPVHLEQLLAAYMKHPNANIGFSKIEVFGDARDAQEKETAFNHSVERCLKIAFDNKENNIWVSNRNLLYVLLQYGFPFRCQASLVKKDFILKNSLRFDEDIVYTQDSQYMIMAAYFTPFFM